MSKYMEKSKLEHRALREYILSNDTGDRELKRLSKGMNSEIIAAVTKLMSNLDLVHATNKVEILSTCNITIGQKGRCHLVYSQIIRQIILMASSPL